MSAPNITQQPVNVTADAGTVATFTAKATGATSADLYKLVNGGGVLYGSNVPDGTGTVNVSVPNGSEAPLSASDAGSYEFVFRNSTDNPPTSTTSNTVTLTVNTPTPPPATPVAPRITTQPASQTIGAGLVAVFEIVVTGTPTPTLSWRKGATVLGGSRVSGQGTTTFRIYNLQPGDAGNYQCVVANSAGTVTSANATLTVGPAYTPGTGTSAAAPLITSQPAGATVAIGGTAALTVAATSPNGSPLSYLWKKGGVPIAGATNATLTLANVTTASYGSYTCDVTNSAGTVTSAAATLTISATGGTGTGGTTTTTLSTEWTLSAAGGASVPAALLGITDIAFAGASQAVDTCTLTVGGRNVDAAPLFSNAEIVVVYRAGAPWFTGRVTQLPASGSAAAHAHTYTLSGPWWYLEHLTFTQTWQIKNATATAQLGRAILGMDLDGNPVTTGAVIREALTYAVEAGAPFVVGEVLGGFTIPFDEVKDVTCAEVIRKMLRWHPDAVAWFNYATLPPTICIQSRGALGAVTLTVGQRPLVSIGNITPRYDLLAPAVVIAYELTGQENGKSYTDVQYDAAPAGSTGKEFGAAVLTIPLRGQSATTVRQPIIVTPIIDDPDDPSAVAFLVAQYGGALAVAANDPSIGADGITIKDITRTLPDPNAVEYDPAGGADDDGNPATVPVVYDDSLGNMLLQGAISEDMAEQFSLKAQEQRLTVTYTLDSGKGDSDAPSGADYSDVGDDQKFTFDIMATNAVTQPYTTLSSYSAGDQVPTGLAASYLATLDTLQWAGSVVCEEQVAGASSSAGLGTLLNLAGSQQGAWASMQALIVQKQVQASTGRTTLTFGPAAHLTPNEMVARLRVTRPGGMGGRASTGARGTDRSDERSSGAPSGGNTIGGNTKHPLRNSTPVPPKTSAAVGSPTPFQLVQTAPGANVFTLAQASYLRKDFTSAQSTDITGSTTSFALSDGDSVWLQLDFSGGSLNEASIVIGQTAPYESNGGDLITFTGGGTGENDPFVQDQSFTALAQIFAADPSGNPIYGGIVYAVDAQQPPTMLEIVQVTNANLSLRTVFDGARIGMMAFPDSGPLIS